VNTFLARARKRLKKEDKEKRNKKERDVKGKDLLLYCTNIYQ
jgi:hypothetical protein